ncbi:MAG: hypothetical protein ACO3FE_15990 [Planctomycetaceae bacterium]
MTIRYTCSQCESVMKIRDEKSGTDAKCPKCKTPFVVPAAQPTADADAESPDDFPVDMPFELTPDAEIPEITETPQLTPTAPVSKAPEASPGRPSVAELMREHEASKKKETAKKADRQEQTAETDASTGSAADMLARAYQQKRESSAKAPQKSRSEQRAEEERMAMMTFVRTRLLPGAAVLGVLITTWTWWVNREIYDGPPLYAVTGNITVSGSAAEGVRVEFAPSNPGPNDVVLSASAVTDSEGNYELMVYAGVYGAPAGTYVVGLVDSEGLPMQVPDAQVQQTVSDTAENSIDFQL